MAWNKFLLLNLIYLLHAESCYGRAKLSVLKVRTKVEDEKDE